MVNMMMRCEIKTMNKLKKNNVKAEIKEYRKTSNGMESVVNKNEKG